MKGMLTVLVIVLLRRELHGDVKGVRILFTDLTPDAEILHSRNRIQMARREKEFDFLHGTGLVSEAKSDGVFNHGKMGNRIILWARESGSQ